MVFLPKRLFEDAVLGPLVSHSGPNSLGDPVENLLICFESRKAARVPFLEASPQSPNESPFGLHMGADIGTNCALFGF